jgi:hypothetical protein
LLQITAPDPTCGIVFVRGDYPGLSESILARAQLRDESDSKGVFGTWLCPPQTGDDLQLGERIAHGWVNFKWPYAQYDLRRRDDPWNASCGTIEELSFIRNGTYFHLMRIRWGRGSTIKEFDVGGGVRSATPEKLIVKIRCGGVVHFGCTCSNGLPLDHDDFRVTNLPNPSGARTRLSCTSRFYRSRLEMQLFVDGQARELQGSPSVGNRTEIDLTSIHNVELTRHQAALVMSTYAIRQGSVERETVLPSHFKDLPAHLGIASDSPHMTDRLWTALCSINYDSPEAVEMSCVGRAVEQIMSVASLPFAKPRMQGADGEEESPALVVERALIHNIITPQYVDVQSAFYQLRLLVKTHKFIKSRRLVPDFLNSSCPIETVASHFLDQLVAFIRGIVLWLVNTDMSYTKLFLAVPSWTESATGPRHPDGRASRCETHRERLNIERSYNQACYAAMGIWYAVKDCPEAVPKSAMSAILGRLKPVFDRVQTRSERNKDPTAKNDILQWLHVSCLYLLCGCIFEDSDGNPVDGFAASGVKREDVERLHQRFEKYVSRLKTSQSEAYTVYNEELDRLHLLAKELGVGEIKLGTTADLVRTRVLLAKASIRHRKRTIVFMPGPKVREGPRPVSTAPWELIAANHESYLRVGDPFSLTSARDRLFQFMMADYGFMSSWDRADSRVIGKWWDFEHNSIICATILQLKEKGNRAHHIP